MFGQLCVALRPERQTCIARQPVTRCDDGTRFRHNERPCRKLILKPMATIMAEHSPPLFLPSNRTSVSIITCWREPKCP